MTRSTALVATLTVQPDAQLTRNLGRLGTEMGARAGRAAVTAGSWVLVEGMRVRVPFVTGNLMHSINMSGGLGRIAPTTGAAFPPGVVTDTRADYLIGSLTPYSNRIEFGFAGVDALGRRFNQPPQPYVRPAVDEDRGRVLEAVGASYAASLRQAVS